MIGFLFQCEAWPAGWVQVLNIVCLVRTEGFLHFVVSLCVFVYIFQHVERRQVPPFEGVLEAEKFQSVDFVLSTLLRGGLTFPFFLVIHLEP